MFFPALLSNVRLAEGVLNLAFQSLVFLLAGWILSLLFKRASAPARSAGMLALILILALWPLKISLFPAASAGLYRIPVGSLVSPSIDAWPKTPETLRLAAWPAVPGSAKNSGARRSAESGRNSIPSRWAEIPRALLILNGFGLIWSFGTLFFLGRIFYGLALLAFFRRSLLEIHETPLVRILDEIRADSPAMRIPPIFTSPAVNSPIAFGIRRPRIVLPESLLPRLSPAEIRSLLIHESAHLRHRDQLAGIVQRLVAAFYWWNPLIHILNAKYSVAREEVSDNYGILESGARPYALSLVELARKTTLISRLPSAVGIATPHIPLEERIMDIVSKKRDLKTRAAKRVILGMVFVAFSGAVLMGSRGLALAVQESKIDQAAKIVPLPMVKRPMALAVGLDRIYLLDFDQTNRTNEIQILSTSDYSLIRSFGKKGQGLGEFLMSPGIPRIAGTSLWCDDIKKIVVFSPDGDFQKEIPLSLLHESPPRGHGNMRY